MKSPRMLRTVLLGLAMAVGFGLPGCTPTEPPPFDGELALSHVQSQVDFGPRVPGTEGHRRCADWLALELSKYTDDVRRQAFYYVPLTDLGKRGTDTVYLWNIMAAFRTDAPYRIMMCAHWDSRPWADQDPDSANHNTPIPGANDGGSGVAVCLELARLMSAVPPDIGVDLVLFDGEDQGPSGKVNEYLIGSRWFASKAPNYRPLAVILLDMVGDRDLGIVREAYSDSLAPGLTDLVWATADSLGLTEFSDSVGTHVIDDHLPFLFNGIPAVDIIDFDYAYWHTVEDTMDKVSAESLERIGRLMVALIYRTPAESYREAAAQSASP
jgi:glutaminyl-peptide cyclotransferase